MIFKALKTNFYNGSGTLKNKLKIEENSNYLQLTNKIYLNYVSKKANRR